MKDNDKYEYWSAMLAQEVEKAGDTIVSSTLTRSHLLRQFYNGWGAPEGCKFTAWGEKYVYFPVTFAEAEWVAKVLRNPLNDGQRM